MFAASDNPHLTDLGYIEKVNQKAQSYSEEDKLALKRILSYIVEKVITKKELENPKY